ncbi:MAG: Lar family restriction alleviation protein [Patescibacteria group bacterium]|nr:Lar family restriction alleviation protein [Patescibacteria group bacterium]
MNQQIKDCPFCDEKPIIYPNGKCTIVIYCSGCGINRKQKYLKLSKEELIKLMIEHWNKRVKCGEC